jgi:hypothetical protein
MNRRRLCIAVAALVAVVGISLAVDPGPMTSPANAATVFHVLTLHAGAVTVILLAIGAANNWLRRRGVDSTLMFIGAGVLALATVYSTYIWRFRAPVYGGTGPAPIGRIPARPMDVIASFAGTAGFVLFVLGFAFAAFERTKRQDPPPKT